MKTPLTKRQPLVPEALRVKLGLSAAMRSFHSPQRPRRAKVQHPKPQKGDRS